MASVSGATTGARHCGAMSSIVVVRVWQQMLTFFVLILNEQRVYHDPAGPSTILPMAKP
jgi:hypothetical protein